MSLRSDSIGTYIIARYEDTGDCLKQRKEETTAVGTLHLLDHDVRHDHLQCTLQSSAHTSNRSARVQLSSHSHSSSPRLTPSPSPRANQIPLPSGPRESMYDASISGTGASSKGPGTYSADVRGSAYTSGQLDDSDSESGSDSETNITSMVVRVEERPVCPHFLQAAHHPSSPIPALYQCLKTCTHHPVSHPRLASRARGVSLAPTSRSRSHVSPEIRKGQPSLSPASKRILQFCEGPPDTHLASGERCNGEHDDEDEHGDSNAHSGSSTRNPSPTPGMVSGLGSQTWGLRRVTEQDVMWTDLVWDVLKESAADFAEMGDV
ncbi:hypothetical protein BU17DRAFT_79711 [Hysterangium stoloniferum]|nr:hypothetical protein BU17DRAFT_79711 [Hysterangium stoloniferum]